MQKLLALVDGSEYTDRVCELATWFADRLSADIELVHVLGQRETSLGLENNLSGSIGLGARTALLEELAELDLQKAKLAHKQGRAILEGAVELLAEGGMTRVETKLRNAEVVETVEEYEDETQLVIIGKRGVRANVDAQHIGSNLERVVRSSKKPVLVASRVVNPIQSMLIAYDGGSSAQKAVDYLLQHTCFTDIKCHLITVGDNQEQGLAKLQPIAQSLQQAGYEVHSDVLSGQPEVAIAQKVETDGIGLLLMGAYGHSRIRSLIIGSTTTEMVRSCKIPLMLFR